MASERQVNSSEAGTRKDLKQQIEPQASNLRAMASNLLAMASFEQIELPPSGPQPTPPASDPIDGSSSTCRSAGFFA